MSKYNVGDSVYIRPSIARLLDRRLDHQLGTGNALTYYLSWCKGHRADVVEVIEHGDDSVKYKLDVERSQAVVQEFLWREVMLEPSAPSYMVGDPVIITKPKGYRDGAYSYKGTDARNIMNHIRLTGDVLEIIKNDKADGFLYTVSVFNRERQRTVRLAIPDGALIPDIQIDFSNACVMGLLSL